VVVKRISEHEAAASARDLMPINLS
jgi:hypothetical protein